MAARGYDDRSHPYDFLTPSSWKRAFFPFTLCLYIILVGSVTFRSWVQLGQEQDVVVGPGKRCISALDVRRHLVLDLAGKAITDTLGVGRFLEHMNLLHLRWPRPALSDPSVSPAVPAPFELFRDMARGRKARTN